MMQSDVRAIPWSLDGKARRFRIGEALRRAWLRLISLPDQGAAAKPLPPEFFRFPRF